MVGLSDLPQEISLADSWWFCTCHQWASWRVWRLQEEWNRTQHQPTACSGVTQVLAELHWSVAAYHHQVWKVYIPLNCSQLDNLCWWVSEMRERFIHIGRKIFERSCVSSLNTAVEILSSSLAAGVISSKEKEAVLLQGKATLPVRPPSRKRSRKTMTCVQTIDNG